MSPLDMLIFLFFILVTIKAATASIEHWKDLDEEASRSYGHRTNAVSATLSRTVRTGRPSSVRVTPIKRVDVPSRVTASSRRYEYEQYSLKDKGAA
ncbi:MAG: hypothetical protein K5875_05965 [Saccharofermentans sp.]|nr:hypothetical protein [Saccharofermentans sp.]